MSVAKRANVSKAHSIMIIAYLHTQNYFLVFNQKIWQLLVILRSHEEISTGL